MSWQVASFAGLAIVLVVGFAWYERTRPSARVVALVAALAALAVAGRLVLAPIPNVVGTTDVALLTGYALGGAPGFAVGALAAPISNIWLGQGPWTIWQMAGWGLAGLAGAGLAVAFGRHLGRLALACACAAMALVYGALLDLSVMVTYGGEQSLDRYLALSARGVPFNVAHALGNFAIAFAAGPALVAMIERYRTRLEFRWHPAGALPAALAALALAAAAMPHEEAGASPGSARSWLEHAREGSGGYAATPGSRANPQMTGWAMLGLEAAGRNPLDVGPRGGTPVDYLKDQARRIRSANELELAILAFEGAGLDASRFAGRNLVAELRDEQLADGSWQGQVNLTAYGVLALRAAGSSGGISRAATWLRSAQRADGGWGFGPSQPSDPDSTGAAMQGLAGAGGGGLDGGIAYLRRTQRREGGWGLNETGVTNSQSTAWAIQGLVAAGVDPAQVKTHGRSGLDYLAARQRGDGSYAYNAASAQTPVWVTSQALLAVSREALPVEPVGRDVGGAPAPAPDVEPGAEPPASTAPESSHGGGSKGGRSDQGDRGAQRPEKGNEGERSRGSARDEAPAAADVLAERAATDAPPEEAAGDSTGAIVAAGLGGLALALGGGWLWYRRRLP